MKKKKEPEFKSGYAALLGRPNVGKSSILNFFLREKIAIISEKPQTTRENILGIYNEKNAQIIFVDTPGLHKPKTKLGVHMQNSARAAAEDVDVLLIIVDASSGMTSRDLEMFRSPSLKIRSGQYRWVCVLANKVDKMDKKGILLFLDRCAKEMPADDYIPVSAKTGFNLDLVLNKIKDKILPGPAYYPADQLTDKNERFVVSELIREQALKLTRQEVPHAVAVMIEKFKDDPGKKTVIAANIFVEQDSQKKIIIGRGGQMLKKIGTASRIKVENLLGRKIFLELWVKVHKNWRKDEAFLKQLGYGK